MCKFNIEFHPWKKGIIPLIRYLKNKWYYRHSNKHNEIIIKHILNYFENIEEYLKDLNNCSYLLDEEFRRFCNVEDLHPTINIYYIIDKYFEQDKDNGNLKRRYPSRSCNFCMWAKPSLLEWIFCTCPINITKEITPPGGVPHSKDYLCGNWKKEEIE